ncbi:trifunctional dihydropteroate synthetase [Ceratocystis pirilliformis]|uniref:Trifunctional dihydropteroate synthetase n=1 Tax=Ceratocystis pirilliformis TaxID=259994 RepID=A0ABR3YH62_9PEZI
MGDRFAEIERACREIEKRGIRVKRTSSLWETAPMYVIDQDRFVNGACEVETHLGPMELLDALQDIENTMGRHKVIDKGPRNIDLDILLYGDQKIHNDRLNVPHIGIREREFVLRPLAELIPDKPLYPEKPWMLVQDYLNKLPLDKNLSPLIPLSPTMEPISSFKATRRTHVMGILNVTPDSFSDGGVNTRSSLPARISSAIASGATILDVGGQSTAPGTPEVTTDEEIARVLPAIHAIRSLPEGKSVAISIDTYRAAVAKAAVKAGADIINDVSAGQMDPEMLHTMAQLECTVCLMHMRGTPATMQGMTDYTASDGVVGGVASELVARVRAAEKAGIRRWRIILDPGLGFAKTPRQNIRLLGALNELRSWPGLVGLPWLVGASRKGFVGRATGVKHPAERIWGTAATVAAAIQGGADIVRVHDVKQMAQVARMADWIWRLVDSKKEKI